MDNASETAHPTRKGRGRDGHPEYFPRFGFRKAGRWGLTSPFDVPDDAFMALELVKNALKDKKCIVRYQEAFYAL